MKLYLDYQNPETAFRMFKAFWPSFWNTCKGNKAVLTLEEDKLTRSGQRQNKLCIGNGWRVSIEKFMTDQYTIILKIRDGMKGLQTRFNIRGNIFLAK
jgi:hypothetical protein